MSLQEETDLVPRVAPVLSVLLFCLVFAASAPAQTAPDAWNVAPAPTLVDRVNVLPNAPALIHSLGLAANLAQRHSAPSDLREWENRRPAVEAAFRQALGLQRLPERSPLQARTVSQLDRGAITIEKIIFESRPGFPVTANLYRPSRSSTTRRPAVLSPIGHFLSAGKTAPDVQARCLGLAHKGFVVLTYDAIGQGERMVMGNVHHEAGYALLPLGETIAGWMVWDSMRAIDYLQSREDVDPARIGITGNSGGGLNSLFTAALDPRVQAATVVGFTLEFSDWIRYGGTHCTCTHLPGLLRDLEWFEIAGLIAPRPLLMIQGEHDTIFPIQGASRAAEATELVYRLSGYSNSVRFLGLSGQPHAYTRPFREPMYEWMIQHLGGGPPSAQPSDAPLEPWPERDPRLLCHPEGRLPATTPTVVDLAASTARRLVARFPDPQLPERRAAVRTWVEQLTAPTAHPPAHLAPRTVRPASGNAPEKLTFLSEPGVEIPALLWRSSSFTGRSPVVVLIADRGKAWTAESGLVEALLSARFAVFACDLRGRGESLSRYGPRHDINFRLIASQVLAGQPLAGRRAFDVQRVVDFLQLRPDLDTDNLAVIGIGDDALPVLLAAATDPRLKRVAIHDFLHSFASAILARPPVPVSDMGHAWNDPQLDGRLRAQAHTVDLGSVVPSVLEVADVPDVVALLAPRPLLACGFRDVQDADIAPLAVRFRNALRSPTANTSEYSPETPLDAAQLLAWLERSKASPPVNPPGALRP
jgi:cephalosporin-C deacetylase-like acetyl esterase